mmetsp:Transcript_9630/g.40868  ORF Transcript_9630/g.40868 Transcript_9630/m.40868 type:complete len:207 (+) Transcript_9630:785-1405(+)
MRSVASVVRVAWHRTCGMGGLNRFGPAPGADPFSNAKGDGAASPGCGVKRSSDQSMDLPSSRGGVPVFMRPILKPAPYRRAASAFAAAAAAASGFSVSAVGARPAGTGGLVPTRMTPLRNVPVAITAVGAFRTTPESSLTPATRADVCAVPFSFAVNTRSSTAASITSSRGVAPTNAWISLLYAVRSICALGPRTAGPLEAFSTRN